MLPAHREARWCTLRRIGPGRPRGFALPLALFALVLLALLAALLLDGALQDLRASRGEVALAGAQGAAESAFADVMTAPTDSSFATMPRGDLRVVLMLRSTDTTRVSVQSLGGGLFRVVTAARAWSFGVRADVGTLALVRLSTDSAVSSGLHFRRLPGLWWAPQP